MPPFRFNASASLTLSSILYLNATPLRASTKCHVRHYRNQVAWSNRLAPQLAKDTIWMTAIGERTTRFGAGARVDPVMGTFSFSFDNAASFIGGGSLTISLSLPGTIGRGTDYNKAADSLVIGDVSNGACCVIGGDDYAFAIHNVS